MKNEMVVGDTTNGSGSNPAPDNEALSTSCGIATTTTGAGTSVVWDALGPGDSIEFTGPYVVTLSDDDTLQKWHYRFEKRRQLARHSYGYQTDK